MLDVFCLYKLVMCIPICVYVFCLGMFSEMEKNKDD